MGWLMSWPEGDSGNGDTMDEGEFTLLGNEKGIFKWLT